MNRNVRHLFLVWAGLVIGVSLLATPVKFLAPDLGLEPALQVARVTFRALSVTELVLLLLAFALTARYSPIRFHTMKWPLAIAVILAVQYLVVLPLLAARADDVATGAAPGQVGLHALYILAEVGKLGILLTIGLRRTEP